MEYPNIELEFYCHLNEKGEKTFSSKKDVLNLYCRFIKGKTKDDVAWMWVLYGSCEIGALNISNLNVNMKGWREYAKKGELFIKKDKCGSVKSFDGNEWHYLVLNCGPEGHQQIDPFGYFLFDLTIIGEMIFFKHKSNRDKVQEYVMRRLEK